MENCPYCNEFMDIAADTQNCTHRSIDPQNEFCCPNCDVHFDSGLNEVPNNDLGIARPDLSGGEYIPPPPAPEPTPPSDSKSDSSTTPTTPTKPKVDSIYAPPPSKNLSSQKVIKSIESLQSYLK